ncbi:hypothetical protein ARC272_03470 [Pantoea ananatis]|nr:hypothetical protein ARC272_03470 [Pantoea ananatis]
MCFCHLHFFAQQQARTGVCRKCLKRRNKAADACEKASGQCLRLHNQKSPPFQDENDMAG